ncbi:3D domain-containing protein [Jeotgalibaca sp. MA1X17-3]|uniref:3D domain-containing protein n=1 Tax=Jeotgalibaca sp. MA1X17-3 TaxID=2908211 RepID=UPI00288334D7|nr:3D domain-containing protein [Jeotgalibaca sp. MA1X17-3]
MIAARREQLEARLVALQVSPSTTNRVMMLFDSENFTDFVGRFVALAQIQSADKEQIVSAMEEEEKLKELEETLAEQVVTIKEKTTIVETELAEFDKELESLQILMADNQEGLNQILTKKENEKVRLEEVAAAEKVAAAEQAAKAETATKASETTQSTQTTQSSSVSTPVVEKQEQPAVEAPASTNGRTLSVSATAYSRHEAGLSNFTATGIDLRRNSMVIAVDPNVIPLGSLLDVPGYGIAIAGDTGGAIKGNKIDLHMEDVGRMNAFGRQQMTITILN